MLNPWVDLLIKTLDIVGVLDTVIVSKLTYDYMPTELWGIIKVGAHLLKEYLTNSRETEFLKALTHLKGAGQEAKHEFWSRRRPKLNEVDPFRDFDLNLESLEMAIKTNREDAFEHLRKTKLSLLEAEDVAHNLITHQYDGYILYPTYWIVLALLIAWAAHEVYLHSQENQQITLPDISVKSLAFLLVGKVQVIKDIAPAVTQLVIEVSSQGDTNYVGSFVVGAFIGCMISECLGLYTFRPRALSPIPPAGYAKWLTELQQYAGG